MCSIGPYKVECDVVMTFRGGSFDIWGSRAGIFSLQHVIFISLFSQQVIFESNSLKSENVKESNYLILEIVIICIS